MTDETLHSLHHRLPIDRLDDEPHRVTIDVTPEDCARLARRFDVLDIASLRGDMDVTRSGSIIRVAGSIEADLGRRCVVSLEDMRERIAEDFAVDFTTEPAPEPDGEIEADLDAPEPLRGDTIDLGDVLLEQLVLAMDPHPRKEGAQPPEDRGAGDGSSPFDVLKDLKG